LLSFVFKIYLSVNKFLVGAHPSCFSSKKKKNSWSWTFRSRIKFNTTRNTGKTSPKTTQQTYEKSNVYGHIPEQTQQPNQLATEGGMISTGL